MNIPASGRPVREKDHRGRGDSVALTTACLFMMLVYPVLGMFWHHAYPLLSAEAAIILAACAAVALALSVLLRFTRSAVRNLVVGVMVTIAFMVHFNLLFVGMTGVLAVSVVLGMLLRERYTEFVAVILAALIFGSWLDNRLNPATKLTDPQPSTAPAGRGPVVHILLDGFMAPDGLPRDNEASVKLREEVVAFFRDHEFELHNRAYSHYNSTLDSMTRAFNFGNDNANLFQRAAVLREPLSFPQNAWFDILQSLGYPIHVYQSESVDFCSAGAVQPANCNVFPIPNLKTINRDVSELGVRVEVLLRTLAGQSGILTKTLREARILDTWGIAVQDERMLPKLAQDLLIRPADAFFAHVMVPHSPFVFREDCSIDYGGARGLRWAYLAGGGDASAASMAKRDEKRAAQTRCALRLLDGLFDIMRSSGVFDDATIIVHGDHGTSVHRHYPSAYNADRLSRRDLLEAFSTLFAVKWPGGKGAIRTGVDSLNVLLAQTARRLTGQRQVEPGSGVEAEAAPFVYLTDVEPLRRLDVNIFDDRGQGLRHQ